MNGIEDQDPRPGDVDSPDGVDSTGADARIAEHLAERGGDEPDTEGQVPAGGAGADAGAGAGVRVDPASRSSVPDESTHNDEPGVGTRRAHGPRRGQADDAASPAVTPPNSA